ncbi:single-pass membrane and coiled-coil domain-containing protein 3 [Amia ocellicauda]|uniref:single-pass membrane and coiled-coil domain-containing protein 3 n=1 Tax=Amia ocellicauda TaxID=2972642 RepID=UPI0034645A8B
MSWTDILYPENERKREEVYRLSQQFLEGLRSAFRVTNRLLKALNARMGCSLEPLELDEKATVKDNCRALVDCIRRVQREVEPVERALRERLEPAVYERLLCTTTPISEKIRTLETSSKATLEVLQGKACLMLTACIMDGRILTRMVAVLGKVGTCMLANVAVGLIGLGVDVLISAILGAVEKRNLDLVLQEYRALIEDFRPANEKYQDDLTYVVYKIEQD